jgi:hypothetical protein
VLAQPDAQAKGVDKPGGSRQRVADRSSDTGGRDHVPAIAKALNGFRKALPDETYFRTPPISSSLPVCEFSRSEGAGTEAQMSRKPA